MLTLVDSEGTPVAKVDDDTLQPGLFYHDAFEAEYKGEEDGL